ncbi:MAG: DNA-binding protein [Gemmatimonadota bacterium]|nr:DNA-binding protein [Gemmatimonadota bacterium]
MRRNTPTSKCELTTNAEKRAAANNATAAIKEDLPAGLAQPALRALAGAGYTSLNRLASVSEPELAALHGMGPKAIGIIKAALEGRGMSLRA